MDIDELADRVWDAVKGERSRTLRKRTNSDPIWIGLLLLIVVFGATNILSWRHSIVVVGVLMALGIARLVYLRRTNPRDQGRADL